LGESFAQKKDLLHKSHSCTDTNKKTEPKTMNTNSSTSPDTYSTQQFALASDMNALSLQSPQRFARPLVSGKARALKKAAALQACPSALQLADLPQGNPPVIHLEHSVELTYGPDPQRLVQRAMSKVSHPALKSFLRTVLAQNLVNLVLTMPPMNNQRVQRLPIDRLRSTAEEAMRWCDLSKGERETLYVAILVAGHRTDAGSDPHGRLQQPGGD
jgi:hypothetical protein